MPTPPRNAVKRFIIIRYNILHKILCFEYGLNCAVNIAFKICYSHYTYKYAYLQREYRARKRNVGIYRHLFLKMLLDDCAETAKNPPVISTKAVNDRGILLVLHIQSAGEFAVVNDVLLVVFVLPHFYVVNQKFTVAVVVKLPDFLSVRSPAVTCINFHG